MITYKIEIYNIHLSKSQPAPYLLPVSQRDMAGTFSIRKSQGLKVFIVATVIEIWLGISLGCRDVLGSGASGVDTDVMVRADLTVLW